MFVFSVYRRELIGVPPAAAAYIVPVVGSLVVDGPGWAMACSDGLWNYASEPSAIRAQMDAAGTTDPGALALALVEFAKAAGGHDNITVALARVEP